MATVELHILDGADDGDWSIVHFGNSATLVEVGDINAGLYDVRTFLRFTGVPLQRGSVIQSATLYLTAASSSATLPTIDVHCEDADDAVAPTDETDAESRALTTAVANWTPSVWTAGTEYSTDVLGPVNEVIARSGWAQGNALQFILRATATGWGGARFVVAKTFDDSEAVAARLVIVVSDAPLAAVAAHPPATAVGGIVVPATPFAVVIAPTRCDVGFPTTIEAGVQSAAVSPAPGRPTFDITLTPSPCGVNAAPVPATVVPAVTVWPDVVAAVIATTPSNVQVGRTVQSPPAATAAAIGPPVVEAQLAAWGPPAAAVASGMPTQTSTAAIARQTPVANWAAGIKQTITVGSVGTGVPAGLVSSMSARAVPTQLVQSPPVASAAAGPGAIVSEQTIARQSPIGTAAAHGPPVLIVGWTGTAVPLSGATGVAPGAFSPGVTFAPKPMAIVATEPPANSSVETIAKQSSLGVTAAVAPEVLVVGLIGSSGATGFASASPPATVSPGVTIHLPVVAISAAAAPSVSSVQSLARPTPVAAIADPLSPVLVVGWSGTGVPISGVTGLPSATSIPGATLLPPAAAASAGVPPSVSSVQSVARQSSATAVTAVPHSILIVGWSGSGVPISGVAGLPGATSIPGATLLPSVAAASAAAPASVLSVQSVAKQTPHAAVAGQTPSTIVGGWTGTAGVNSAVSATPPATTLPGATVLPPNLAASAELPPSVSSVQSVARQSPAAAVAGVTPSRLVVGWTGTAVPIATATGFVSAFVSLGITAVGHSSMVVGQSPSVASVTAIAKQSPTAMAAVATPATAGLGNTIAHSPAAAVIGVTRSTTHVEAVAQQSPAASTCAAGSSRCGGATTRGSRS